MDKDFIEVARVPLRLEKGKKYQVEVVGSEVVISKMQKAPEWVDITKSCHLEFRDSHYCNGRYIATVHSDTGRPAVIIGMSGLTA